jgi:hypothetical protein
MSPTPNGRTPVSTEERRFTLFARTWAIGLAILVGAVTVVGQPGVALGILVVGLVGFQVVFDRHRAWWGPKVRESISLQRALTGREKIVFAAAFLLVTIVTLLLALR